MIQDQNVRVVFYNQMEGGGFICGAQPLYLPSVFLMIKIVWLYYYISYIFCPTARAQNLC